MSEIIKVEYEKAIQKRDEMKAELQSLESEKPKNQYNITITRDRLAYWEGKSEGLKFAIDHINEK